MRNHVQRFVASLRAKRCNPARRVCGAVLSLRALDCHVATLLAMTAILLTPQAFAANDIPPSPIVKTALIVHAPETQRSNQGWAGVQFEVPRGWHIYYKDPGDAGIPTTLTWSLPKGWTTGDIVWPRPSQFEMSGIKSIGYSGAVTLLAPIRSAGTLRGEISVKADWLVCKEICIPESARFTATLPVTTRGAAEKVQYAVNNTERPAPEAGWMSALVLAFLGGLILNFMPCVLPILALKALAVAKKADASRRDAARQGAAYTLGVVGSFLAIAAAMLALKAGGAAVGWGFQLQNPWFVGALSLVMLAVAANLYGLFELPVLLGGRATHTDDSTLRGALLTGALAVLVATPCTAPFMATALGATLTMPTLQALSVFAVLGIGMAFPFLLISLWPAARRLLPKPGVWMLRFKKLLALPMLVTALWLGWVCMQLLQPSTQGMAMPHEAFSVEKLEALRAKHQPVLVDATADWCLTCKVNERVALSGKEMQQFLREQNVTLMVADWTRRDAAIGAYLAEFGRNGVPLYVYYPPKAAPVVLPQLLTPSVVRDAILGKGEE